MTERKFKVGDKVVSTERGYNSVDGWPNGTIVIDEGGLFRVEFGDGSALAHFEEDMIHETDAPISPHYTTDADGKDYLQRFFENETPESVRGAMVFTIGKYIERLGKKDAPEKELAKVIDYCTRYRDFLTK